MLLTRTLLNKRKLNEKKTDSKKVKRNKIVNTKQLTSSNSTATKNPSLLYRVFYPNIIAIYNEFSAKNQTKREKTKMKFNYTSSKTAVQLFIIWLVWLVN